MLCSNLFVSQLLFLVGIEQTKHQVKDIECVNCTTDNCYVFLLVCLFRNSCSSSVHVSSFLHVDANGRRCLVRNTCKGFH